MLLFVRITDKACGIIAFRTQRDAVGFGVRHQGVDQHFGDAASSEVRRYFGMHDIPTAVFFRVADVAGSSPSMSIWKRRCSGRYLISGMADSPVVWGY